MASDAARLEPGEAPDRTSGGQRSGTARPERVAVVDIGSNSIRLVVFEGLKRVPTPVFNEKVICGLGRDINSTGKLSEAAVEMAVPNLKRFVRLAEGMGVGRIDLLATAACREAENGPAFVEEVEKATGQKVQVLSGRDEARIAALGVIAGTPEAAGVMGDLGGGSLELVQIADGGIGESVTLPLGPLRLADLSGGKLPAAQKEIAARLAEVPWLGNLPGSGFYAVGGAWRALARILIDQRSYPLHVIHGYAVPRAEVDDTMRILGGLGQRSLTQIRSVSRRRLESIPYAALLLRQVLKVTGAREVVWSSYGLREGFLYDQLPKKEQKRDPLLLTVEELAHSDGRFPDFGEAVIDWTAPIFPKESDQHRRLREAACYLSDVAWREHPDYRARQALWRILHFPIPGIDHPGRAFLAYAVHSRYNGSSKDPEVATALELMNSKERKRARTLGLALRLAFALAAGVPDLLANTRLKLDDDKLILTLPRDGSVPSGDVVEKRFGALTDSAGLKGEIKAP